MVNVLQFELSDKTAEHLAQTATYGGGVSSVALWGLSAPDIAAIVGATVAVIGFGFQIWLGLRRDQRDEEFHWKRMDEDGDE